MSLTGRCDLFAAFLGAVEDLHSRGDGLLTERHLLGARDRSLSHEVVAKCAVRDYGATFHFLEGSENRGIELGAVAFKFLRLLRKKPCPKSKETSAELFFAAGLLQRGGCEIH